MGQWYQVTAKAIVHTCGILWLTLFTSKCGKPGVVKQTFTDQEVVDVPHYQNFANPNNLHLHVSLVISCSRWFHNAYTLTNSSVEMRFTQITCTHKLEYNESLNFSLITRQSGVNMKWNMHNLPISRFFNGLWDFLIFLSKDSDVYLHDQIWYYLNSNNSRSWHHSIFILVA